MFYLTASTVLLLFYCNRLRVVNSERGEPFDFASNVHRGIKNMLFREEFTFSVECGC